MKYFMDFKFLEGDVPVKLLGYNIPKWLIKPNNTIQPISIGLVCSDGREYYAISKDFNLKEAWNRCDIKTRYDAGGNTFQYKCYWIRENVLKPIFDNMTMWDRDDDKHSYFTYKNFKYLINKYGKSNKQIADEIHKFVIYKSDEHRTNCCLGFENAIKPEFYGYYADYYWVVFCWLFGRMIDLPKGFPMYCIDLKQMLDITIRKKVTLHCKFVTTVKGVKKQTQLDDKKINTGDISEAIKLIKNDDNYPKQINEHNALSDAIFCKDLYNFLNSI